MNPKTIFAMIATGVLLVVGIIVVSLGLGHNNLENWQVVQHPGGEIEIRDEPGFYYQGFSNVWTYPRASSFEWGPIGVTFNDGGNADLHGTTRFRTPVTKEQRILMHSEFSGDESLENAKRSIISHLINSVKVTGPVMSGSEHQSARKGEFYSLVFSQFKDGLYQTIKVQRELLDQTDTSGQPITVFATEVVLGDNGRPLIDEVSPLSQYGFDIAQFSIEDTDYDPKTLELFASKKESLLNAERSKAEREEQVQERLMIEERGLKEKAEIEAQANKEKARLTIEAETKVAVASEEADQALEIQRRSTTEAETRRQVAELDLAAAELNADAIRATAAAEEERILKAGAITENDRILAEISRETQIGVARELSQVKVPGVMFMGSGEGGGGGSMGNLMNLWLMQRVGMFPNSGSEASTAKVSGE